MIDVFRKVTVKKTLAAVRFACMLLFMGLAVGWPG